MQREEGGTPAIVDSIRAGLVFQLKQAVGLEIDPRARGALPAPGGRGLAAEPGIEILGNLAAQRLSIVSFVVRAPTGRYLHHNFVVALLNDLFGIQSRGGCSCAGPYGHRLLGIDLERSHEFEREITGGCEGIKPGWVRVNFNYFISETVFDYVVEAVRLVARDGWRLLPDYRFEPETGLWRHAGARQPSRRCGSGTSATTTDGVLRYPRQRRPGAGHRAGRLPGRGGGAVGSDRQPRPHALPPAGRRRRPGLGRLRAPALVRAAGRLLSPIATRSGSA